ncbi:unnamed protein product [Rotaria sp. Silwood1]|nr:unnamed protein product [Rotaria sp. Silwood1]CAF4930951.1 unnamed protein product [Rotaria sp. Silwood1]
MPDKAFRSHYNQRTYDMTSYYLASCLSSMTNDNSKSSNNAMCMVSEWSSWSHCCVTCDTGMRIRSRTMLKGRDNPQCQSEYQLMEKETCHGMKPSCQQGRLTDIIEKKRICMQSLETGTCTQYEQRFYFNLDMNKCLEFDYSGCGANDNNFLARDACEDTCDILLRGRTEDGKDTRCMTLPWSEWSACSSVCRQEFRDCEVLSDSAQIYRLSDTRKTMIKSMETAEKKNKCMQPFEPGPCTKFINRFSFDVTTRKYSNFQYDECRDDENNFMTQDECEAMRDELIQNHKSSIGFFSKTHDRFFLISISEWSSYMNAICHQVGTQIRTRMYANKRAAMAAHCTEHLEQQCTLDGDNNQSKNKQKEMMMTSLWSKQSHPKDWLPEHLHWSDIIGAVHSEEYSLWNFGDIASNGLKQTKLGVIRNLMIVLGLWTVNTNNYEELHHPIDAGTDMGVRYDGPKRPENPRNQPPPFAKLSIKRIMVQGVACPNGRP